MECLILQLQHCTQVVDTNFHGKINILIEC